MNLAKENRILRVALSKFQVSGDISDQLDQYFPPNNIKNEDLTNIKGDIYNSFLRIHQEEGENNQEMLIEIRIQLSN